MPVPASTNPLLRLTLPEMKPWQFTGSLIETVPAKPFPAGTVSVVPRVWVKPNVLAPAKLVAALNPAGTIKSELALDAQRDVP